jgi:hypothetical protein
MRGEMAHHRPTIERTASETRLREIVLQSSVLPACQAGCGTTTGGRQRDRANGDARSLRVQCRVLWRRILPAALADSEERILGARAVSLEDIDGRPLVTKVRDGIIRLFTPYL